MKPQGVIFLILAVFLGMGIGPSYAQGVIIFGPKETKLEGAIPYSVIGTYKARFRDFKGKVSLGRDYETIKSVDLEIKAGSIISNCPWCDRMARSRRLLNTAVYPEIIFKSEKIIHDENGLKVFGVLAMHGIKKRMIFPFSEEIIKGQKFKKEILDLKGSWSINRKDFNIFWNKFLDHGGILVGDYFTVNWRIRAIRK